jgi:hypothetical protein
LGMENYTSFFHGYVLFKKGSREKINVVN